MLPSTAVFASLKNLTLEFVDLAPGSGHLLARLSSSACCPSLLRLRIALRASASSAPEPGSWCSTPGGELLLLSMERAYG
ncbi:unnamed protein product [Miscanthus lutarioriparius]|uniref:Uncharacterized protein n=1 Tax=Miscanthus lutarioriparius TaxID=422564 RepID=A0A811QRU7_9POAL|nr:unnamed protein product [Miscanthus lutarioriparius]